MKKRHLVLENGLIFEGISFGGEESAKGEIVFNTSMTGYQEIITDPSYKKQLVVMTYPHIGSYGINENDFESSGPQIEALIIQHLENECSSSESTLSLNEYMIQNNVPGICNIDTRKLTKIIRSEGSMKCILTKAIEQDDIFTFIDSSHFKWEPKNNPNDRVVRLKKSIYGDGPKIVLVDYGAKEAIIKQLISLNFNITIVPYTATAEEILLLNPEGLVLSNGPGDPRDLKSSIHELKKLLGQVPILGICLGHQLFALACGAEIVEMKFGHHSGNHPVKNLITGSVEITVQNHGYTIDKNTLKDTMLEITHISLNDQSIEGICHKIYPAISVQFHPEASPGPNDLNYIFKDYLYLIEMTKKEQNYAKKN